MVVFLLLQWLNDLQQECVVGSGRPNHHPEAASWWLAVDTTCMSLMRRWLSSAVYLAVNRNEKRSRSHAHVSERSRSR